MSVNINIVGNEKSNGETLLKVYKQKLDRLKLLKKLKLKQRFQKPSEIRKEIKNKAKMRELRREH
ncbi:MAG: 30S ribosomal protein S21 [Cytophagales bacterium]